MFPFKEEGMELAVEEEMMRCISPISINAPLKNAIRDFLKKTLNTQDRSSWDNYAQNINVYLSSGDVKHFINSANILLQLYSPIREKFDHEKFVWHNEYATKIGMLWDFLRLMHQVFIKTIILNKKFATVEAQIALIEPLTTQLPKASYYSSHGDRLLYVWVNILSDLQKNQPLPLSLLPLEQYLPAPKLLSGGILERKVDYLKYAKQIEVLKYPLYDFYQSGLPLDVIESETLLLSNVHAFPRTFMQGAGVAAIWPLKVLETLNKMPTQQQNNWLKVWQHAAKITDNRQPNNAWLQLANSMIPSFDSSFSKQLHDWLKEILADIPREACAAFSDNNEKVICGLLWFASFGDVKKLHKIIARYFRFFKERSYNVPYVAEACLKQWQII